MTIMMWVVSVEKSKKITTNRQSTGECSTKSFTVFCLLPLVYSKWKNNNWIFLCFEWNEREKVNSLVFQHDFYIQKNVTEKMLPARKRNRIFYIFDFFLLLRSSTKLEGKMREICAKRYHRSSTLNFLQQRSRKSWRAKESHRVSATEGSNSNYFRRHSDDYQVSVFFGKH